MHCTPDHPTLRQQAWLSVSGVSQSLAALGLGWDEGRKFRNTSGPLFSRGHSWEKGAVLRATQGGAPRSHPLSLGCSSVSLELRGQQRLSQSLGKPPFSCLSPSIWWVRAWMAAPESPLCLGPGAALSPLRWVRLERLCPRGLLHPPLSPDGPAEVPCFPFSHSSHCLWTNGGGGGCSSCGSRDR